MTFKGRQQLVWSKGLRKKLGLAQEKTDQELAEEEREQAYILAQLSISQWQQVLGNDIRAELLEVAATGDSVVLREFLEEFGICGVEYPGLLELLVGCLGDIA